MKKYRFCIALLIFLGFVFIIKTKNIVNETDSYKLPTQIKLYNSIYYSIDEIIENYDVLTNIMTITTMDGNKLEEYSVPEYKKSDHTHILFNEGFNYKFKFKKELFFLDQYNGKLPECIERPYILFKHNKKLKIWESVFSSERFNTKIIKDANIKDGILKISFDDYTTETIELNDLKSI